MRRVKSEYRWMLFILVPYVVILVVHFFIPLQFLLSSSPLFQEVYSSKNIDLEQTAVRSLARINSQALETKIQTYLSFVATLNLLLGVNVSDYQRANFSALPLNNAFLANTQPSNSLQSMWFVQNISDASQFDDTQGFIFESYQTVEPFIGAYFQSNLNDSLISLSMYVCYMGVNMSFQYPTSPQLEFASLSNPTLPDFYDRTMDNYLLSPTHSLFSVFSEDDEPGMTIICSILFDISQVNSSLGVVCLHFSLVSLANDFVRSFSSSDAIYTTTNYYLLRARQVSQMKAAPNATLQVLFSFEDSNVSRVSYSPSNYSLPSSLQQKLEDSPVGNQLLVFRVSESRTIYQLPITVSATGGVGIIFYLLVQNDFFIPTIFSVSDTIVSTMLIPSTLMIAASVLVSILVLRWLLHGMERELRNINHQCKFIADGDINVEISEYDGSQDIREMYNLLRTINQLAKYSSEHYFEGHFGTKILKYNEALQVFTSLGYNTSAILQNLGECYLYLEDFPKCIDFLIRSVDMTVEQINQGFGGIDFMLRIKQEGGKVLVEYKELEVTLIRKLWKLNFSCMKILELHITTQQAQYNPEDRQALILKLNFYLKIFKKVLYPNFASYSEAVLTLISEAKYEITSGNQSQARQCLNRAAQVLAIYEQQYAATMQALAGQNKSKLFVRRNNLTAHSRTDPLLLRSFYYYVEGVWALKNSQDYGVAFDYFSSGMRLNRMTQSVQFLHLTEIRKMLTELGIAHETFESTEIFRQSVPLRKLHVGRVSKEDSKQVYRFPKADCAGMEREFVFLCDCSAGVSKSWQKYMSGRAEHTFAQLVKPKDRLSIVRFNSEVLLETRCNLILKDSNERALQKEIREMFKTKNMIGRPNLSYAIQKTVERIHMLKSEKILLLFLKDLSVYFNRREQSIRPMKRSVHSQDSQATVQGPFEKTGADLVRILLQQGLRNCKIILMCGPADCADDVKRTFGIEKANHAIREKQADTTNLILVVEHGFKSDLDRILMPKMAIVPDNAVFPFA